MFALRLGLFGGDNRLGCVVTSLTSALGTAFAMDKRRSNRVQSKRFYQIKIDDDEADFFGL